MRNQNVESDLKQLVAPPVPADLRARCLATLPEKVRHNASQTKHSDLGALWRMQRLVLAGGLLAATAVGSAFWTTRPVGNSTQAVSGSVAFAQTMEAMRNIETFHMHRKDRNTEKGGWHSSDWSQLEAWVDTKRGAYATITNSHYATAAFPANSAKIKHTLLLPDGTSYERQNSLLVIFKRMRAWEGLKQQIAPMMLGSVASTTDGAAWSHNFYTGGPMRLQSTHIASWRGKQAQLFVMQASTSRDNLYAPPTMRKIYVDKATNLVMATQDFALFKRVPPLLMSQVEFDYIRPDASLFDPHRLEQGVTHIRHIANQR